MLEPSAGLPERVKELLPGSKQVLSTSKQLLPRVTQLLARCERSDCAGLGMMNIPLQMMMVVALAGWVSEQQLAQFEAGSRGNLQRRYSSAGTGRSQDRGGDV